MLSPAPGFRCALSGLRLLSIESDWPIEFLPIREDHVSLTKEEIEVARTPLELKSFVEGVRVRVESSIEARHLGYLKRGLLKDFVDEIMPLAACAHRLFGEDLKIKPILGNQGYDAAVFDLHGNEVQRIEIANPKLGSVDVERVREVIRTGFAPLPAPDDELERLLPIVGDVARKKSVKDYSGCLLLFIISTTSTPLMAHQTQRVRSLSNEIVEQLRIFKFKAEKVLAFIEPIDKIVEIQGP